MRSPRMPLSLRLGAPGVAALGLLLVVGCQTDGDAPPTQPEPSPRDTPAATGSTAAGAAGSSIGIPPFLGTRAPQLPDVRELDRDHDAVDDAFDREPAAGLSTPSLVPDRSSGEDVEGAEPLVSVEAVFGHPMPPDALSVFARHGGRVRHVFRAVSYGFTGTLPRSALHAAASALGPDLLLLKADRPVQLHLDESTRTGRARPIWAPSFPGGGYSGQGTTIAFIDTGLDGSHPDLAGRMAGFKDYTTDASPTPTDPRGHGTHVAGIGVGSGAAFGIGPGPLKFTDDGDLTGDPFGNWVRTPLHYPPSFTLTSTASWVGGATSLTLLRNDDGRLGGYVVVAGPINGTGTASLSFTGASPPNTHFSLRLQQNLAPDVKAFTIANTLSDYPAVGDGFPALRGVAAGARWYGAKVFRQTGDGTTADISAAMDDMVVLRESLGIKVVNVSFSILNGGTDVTQRAKANTMVESGLVVVASAGNGGEGISTGDPARAANVITVGATNDMNALTEYSSRGIDGSGSADIDRKPDLVAPGGSLYTSKVLSADANTADADGKRPDAVPDDYASIMGTSMAAPFVAGSAALLIEALERAGTPWTYASTASPFLVKLLLLASATELNQPRETGSGNPILGRSAAPKDTYEGYGLINPDAAIEAAIVPFASFDGEGSGDPSAKRAWGRKVSLTAGTPFRVNVQVPATGDYDVYLYSAKPSSKGDPELLAAADRAGEGLAETLAHTPSESGTAYLFVKRISGSGRFAVVDSTCGDGKLDPGEDCDDGNNTEGDCCSAICKNEPDDKTCNDGSVCTKTDRCRAGKCVGEPPCVAPNECQVATCEASGTCKLTSLPDTSPCRGGRCIRGECRRTAGGLGDDVNLIADGDDYTVGGGGAFCTLPGAALASLHRSDVSRWIEIGVPLLAFAGAWIRRRRRQRQYSTQ